MPAGSPAGSLSSRSIILTAKKRVEGEFGLDGHPLLPAQSRMARAALLWSLHEAASAAGLSYRTILRFEKEQRDVQPELIGDLRRAFQTAGVRFIEEGADAGGVVPPPLRVSPPAN
jgi:DNA-binding XRE family transcriptional regulator